MDVQLPDGTTVQGVPDGTTKAQLAEKLKSNGRAVPDDWMTPQKESIGARIGEEIVGAGEGALSAATGIAGGLGGGLNYLGTLAATRDPAAAKAVQEETQQRLTYQPSSKYGKANVAAMGNILETVVEKPTEHAGELTRRGVQAIGASPEVSGAAGAAVKTGLQALPYAAGFRGQKALGAGIAERAAQFAERGEAKAATKAAGMADRNAAIGDAQSVGIRLAPTQAGGILGKTAEIASGSPRLEMELSKTNAPIVTRSAASDIGIGKDSSLLEGMPQKIAEANGKYQVVRKFGRVDMDETYRQKLNSVRDTTSQEGVDFPEDLNEAVEKEIAKFNVAGADANSMMTKIIKLRQRASKNIKTGDAEKSELGYAQKKIANAMEEQLERHGEQIGQGQAVQEFRDARRQLAKIHTVDEALVGTNVSPRLLAKALDRGEPLDGSLLKIAKSYKSFSKVLRDVDTMGGKTPFTVVDYLVGIAGAAHNPALAGAILARPAARAALASRPYQRLGIKPRQPKPSLPTRAARSIANSPNTLESLSGTAGAVTQERTLE